MCHTFLETSEYQLLESLLNFGGKSGDFGPIHRIREKTPKIGGAENPGQTVKTVKLSNWSSTSASQTVKNSQK